MCLPNRGTSYPLASAPRKREPSTAPIYCETKHGEERSRFGAEGKTHGKFPCRQAPAGKLGGVLPGFKEMINPTFWEQIQEFAHVDGLEDDMKMAPEVPSDDRRAWVQEWVKADDCGAQFKQYEAAFKAQSK